jgi:hypothetical protein
VLQAEADDAVMFGLKSPEQDFAQDRTKGISQRHLIGGRQWLAFLLIGAMARSAKG